MARGLIVVSAITAAAVLSAAFAVPRATTCPDGCKCYRDWLNCSYVEFSNPPAGPWSGIDTLWFAGNDVHELGIDFFAEFPDLQNIYLDENSLTVLDLKSFIPVANLKKIRIRDNFIEEIITSGVLFSKLQEVDLKNNSLVAIDQNVFLSFPALKTLYLNDNPLVIPHGIPLLSLPELSYLSLSRTNAALLSPETFQLTPKLSELALIESNVSRLAGAFKSLDSLTYLYLQDNLIMSVDEGELPSGEHLRWLDVSRNPLLDFHPAALNGSIKAGYVYITDTPLSCACLYEDLFRWAKADNTWLRAYCNGKELCGFSV